MSNNYLSKRIGQFEVLEHPGDGLCVVLLHGYGADANDLYPLSTEVRGPKARWLFPNGPLRVPIGGGYEGRSWFALDIEQLQRDQLAGREVDFSKKSLPALSKAGVEIQKMLAQLNLDSSRIVLGGFSQGAMLATEVALTMESSPRALVILSGTLVDQARWRELAQKRKGLKFFQSHGEDDPLLAFAQAERLENLLVTAGLEGHLLPFRGGHGIPPMVIDQLGSFLRNL